MTSYTSRLQSAIDRFDAANGEDPNLQMVADEPCPAELLYAQRMTQWLHRLGPDASEPLRLAARAQHICRWKIPRSDYQSGRDGYRRWRTDLGQFHAETAGQILRDVGYDKPTIDRVKSLLTKQRLKADPECQILEDVICLVFLEHYLGEFTQKHDEAKLINILQRTWNKMSPRGHEAALALDLPQEARRLIDKALGK